MRFWIRGLAVLALAARLQGQPSQQPPPQGQPPQNNPAPAQQPLLEIYQIDLNPSGTGFALSKPVLEGDVYVFKVWPEGDIVRLPKTRVKGITQRTKDLNKEVVYLIELNPTGRQIARENPVRKGKSYVFHTWRDGTLMTLRGADVKKVTRVTGIPAFRIQQEERGAALIGHLPMEGGNARVVNQDPASPAPAPAEGSGTNWSYDGAPGVTDAYAPPSAKVDRPGDVPKAAPTPKPQP
jgi:hypothetical protein